MWKRTPSQFILLSGLHGVPCGLTSVLHCCAAQESPRLVWLRVRVGDLCRPNFQKSIGEVEDERAAELHQLRVQAVSPLGSLGKRRCGRGLWAEVGWAAAKLVHMAARRTNL